MPHEPRHRIVDKRNAHHVPHKDEQRHEREQEREIDASKLLSISKRDGRDDDGKHYAHIDDSRNCEQTDAEQRQVNCKTPAAASPQGRRGGILANPIRELMCGAIGPARPRDDFFPISSTPNAALVLASLFPATRLRPEQHKNAPTQKGCGKSRVGGHERQEAGNRHPRSSEQVQVLGIPDRCKHAAEVRGHRHERSHEERTTLHARRAKRHEGEGDKRDERHVVCHRHACEEDDSHKRERNRALGLRTRDEPLPHRIEDAERAKPGNDSH